jgi:hypothetical protein
MTRFERRAGTGRWIWRRIQQLALVLNESGRRNVSVLRDQLDRVRMTLGAGQIVEELAITLEGYQRASVTIGLTPMPVQVEEL